MCYDSGSFFYYQTFIHFDFPRADDLLGLILSSTTDSVVHTRLKSVW